MAEALKFLKKFYVLIRLDGQSANVTNTTRGSNILVCHKL